MSLEDFIIILFCLVEEVFEQTLSGEPLRSRGFAPKLNDTEVIAIEIIAEFMGFDRDKGIWSSFKTHWQAWFPALGSPSNFARQSSNLWKIK
jgi:hypothetical protein